MLTAVLLAAAIAAGVHPGVVGVVGLAAFGPGWFLAAVAGLGLWSRRQSRRGRPGPEDEARFCQGLAAELKAGAVLRTGLIEAASRAPRLPLVAASRLAAAGRPTEEVAAAIRNALPVNGKAAAAAFRVASQTGARTAELFGGLAIRASEVADHERERWALTAQARLSAWIVGASPLVLFLLSTALGDGPTLLESGPAGYAMAGLGIALEVLGVLVVWLLMRGVRR